MTRFLHSLALLILLAPSLAGATLISFDPTDSIAGLGDTIAIDIIATPENGELIGEFDFIVNFDPTILAFDNLVFGPSLNDDVFFCEILSCRGFDDASGAFEMFEVSLVFPLNTLQDGIAPVLLGTIFFDAIGGGTSDLSFTGNIFGQDPPLNILGDDFGLPLPVLNPGTTTITVMTVSEPGTLLLMFTGLLALTVRRRPVFAIKRITTTTS